MHQQQWLAIVEELGGYDGALPVPNSFPQDREVEGFSNLFVTTRVDGQPNVDVLFAGGLTPGGKGQFSVENGQPLGEVPMLAPPMPQGFAQVEQMDGMNETLTQTRNSDGIAAEGGLVSKVINAVSGS